MVADISITKETLFFISMAFFINMIYGFILGAKFRVIIRHIGKKISFIHAFYVFCITKFSSLITPFFTGSIIGKSLAAKHYANISLREGFLITIFEQLLDFIVLILIFPFLIVSLGGSIFNSSIQLFLIVITFIITIIMLFKYNFIIINLAWKFKNIMPKRILAFGKEQGITKDNTAETFKIIKEYITNKKLLFALFPYLAMQILVIPLVLKFTAAAIGFNMSYSSAFLIYFISVTIGRLSGLPGGFGSADLTMGGLLFIFNMSPVQITSTVILFRILSLLPVIIVGGYLTFYFSTKYSIKLVKEKYK